MKLPEAMWQRILAAAPQGRVERILVRPKRLEPPTLVDTWEVGDSTDHARSKSRAVTLIQAEHLAAMASLLGRPVAFTDLRRNILVSGINLAGLDGRPFRVGNALLEGTEPCHPCKRMVDALGNDGYAAMLGHGGLCAKILEPGTISIGDVVTVGS
jgi:MOSC domain-containing protein YiiM